MQRLEAVVMTCMHAAGMCHDHVCVCVKTSVVFSAAVPFSHVTQEKEEGTALTLTLTSTLVFLFTGSDPIVPDCFHPAASFKFPTSAVYCFSFVLELCC